MSRHQETESDASRDVSNEPQFFACQSPERFIEDSQTYTGLEGQTSVPVALAFKDSSPLTKSFEVAKPN